MRKIYTNVKVLSAQPRGRRGLNIFRKILLHETSTQNTQKTEIHRKKCLWVRKIYKKVKMLCAKAKHLQLNTSGLDKYARNTQKFYYSPFNPGGWGLNIFR